MFCKNCGTENLNSAKFCKSCGEQPDKSEKTSKIKISPIGKFSVGILVALIVGSGIYENNKYNNENQPVETEPPTINKQSQIIIETAPTPTKQVDNTVTSSENNSNKLTEQEKAEKDIPLVKILPYSTQNYSLKISLNENQETTVDALIYIYGADLRGSTKEETIARKKAEVINFLTSKGISPDSFPIRFHTNMD